jgi:Aspartyl protease/Sel1 repeat
MAPFSAPLLFAVTLFVIQPFRLADAADIESPPIPSTTSSHAEITTPTDPNPQPVDLARLTALADAGNPQAQTELALDYLRGTAGAPSDEKRAFALFKRAADQRLPFAEFVLSAMYQEGRGTARNDSLAFDWCHKAAKQGFAEAEDTLGDVYMRGLMGTPVNQSEGRSWYQKAARQNVPSSQSDLALCYFYGHGGPMNRNSALYWAVRSAEARNTTGALITASLYRDSVGSERPNLDLAWIWSSLADLGEPLNDENRKANAFLRKELEAVMPPAQRTKDDQLTAQYRKLRKTGGYILRPDLIDRKEISISHAPGYNKIEMLRSLVALPVMINGKGPFRFILDTGFPASVIDSRLSEKLRLPAFGIHPSFSKTEENQNLIEADYSIFEIQVHHGAFLEMPFGDLSRAVGKQIDGCLGSDFIGSSVVEIDYEAQSIRFLDAETYSQNLPAGAEFQLEFSWGVPEIQVSLGIPDHEPISLRLKVDTGSDRSIGLNAEFDREYSLARLLPKTFPVSSTTVDSIQPAIAGRLRFLDLGAYRILEPIAETPDVFNSTNPSGLIGGEILRRFKLILDYKHSRMFLEPNRNLQKRMEAQFSGFTALPDNRNPDVLRIFKVYPQSPATKAGLREGDVLMEWNGASASKMINRMSELSEFSDSPASPPIETTGKVKRKGKIIPFKLTPEPY